MWLMNMALAMLREMDRGALETGHAPAPPCDAPADAPNRDAGSAIRDEEPGSPSPDASRSGDAPA